MLLILNYAGRGKVTAHEPRHTHRSPSGREWLYDGLSRENFDISTTGPLDLIHPIIYVGF